AADRTLGLAGRAVLLVSAPPDSNHSARRTWRLDGVLCARQRDLLVGFRAGSSSHRGRLLPLDTLEKPTSRELVLQGGAPAREKSRGTSAERVTQSLCVHFVVPGFGSVLRASDGPLRTPRPESPIRDAAWLSHHELLSSRLGVA